MDYFKEMRELREKKTRCQMYKQFYTGSTVMDVLDIKDIEELLNSPTLTSLHHGILICLAGRLYQRQAYVKSTIASYQSRIEAIDIEMSRVKRSLKNQRGSLRRTKSLPNIHI
jgi:hypothetical protein